VKKNINAIASRMQARMFVSSLPKVCCRDHK